MINTCIPGDQISFDTPIMMSDNTNRHSIFSDKNNYELFHSFSKLSDHQHLINI